jgi:hypothetical protein
MTKAMIEMDQRGELTGGAAYIFMKTKPQEELYDLMTDPDEIHNLADSPEHQAKLNELRNALSAWQLEIGDLGFVPEYDLVNMMWPGMVQPETEAVDFRVENGKLLLQSNTDGASIAYQMDESIGGKHWYIYHKPVDFKKGQKVAARAVRIGYKTSEITQYSNH